DPASLRTMPNSRPSPATENVLSTTIVNVVVGLAGRCAGGLEDVDAGLGVRRAATSLPSTAASTEPPNSSTGGQPGQLSIGNDCLLEHRRRSSIAARLRCFNGGHWVYTWAVQGGWITKEANARDRIWEHEAL